LANPHNTNTTRRKNQGEEEEERPQTRRGGDKGREQNKNKFPAERRSASKEMEGEPRGSIA
jgi:hypothetical protein